MVFISVILLGIVIGYPIWDYFYMKYGDFTDKRRMYVKTIVPQWAIVGILFIFWLVTNRSWGALFNVNDPILHSQMDQMRGFGEGVVLAIGVYILLFLFSKKIRVKISGFIEKQLQGILFMLPSTLHERFLFVLVAVTAGICEEVIFRGVMLYELEHLPFKLSAVVMIVIAGILFGIVHLYQGLRGVIGAAYMGGIFFYIYLITGNLWIALLFISLLM